MEKKIKYRIIFFSIIVAVSVIGFIILMVNMISQNGECVDDPFKYAATRLKESGGYYSCSCKSLSPELLDFTFSAEEGIKIQENYYNIDNFFPDIELIEEMEDRTNEKQ